MDHEESTGGSELQQQLDALREQVGINRSDIDALVVQVDTNTRRADDSEAREEIARGRADASEVREEVARSRADASEAQADKDRLRIDDLETHVDVDRGLILELRNTGVLKTEQVAQLEKALRTSRRIGAAIGIIIDRAGVTEEGAFAILRRASQHSNRKLRDIADELVLTGDTSDLRLI